MSQRIENHLPQCIGWVVPRRRSRPRFVNGGALFGYEGLHGTLQALDDARRDCLQVSIRPRPPEGDERAIDFSVDQCSMTHVDAIERHPPHTSMPKTHMGRLSEQDEAGYRACRRATPDIHHDVQFA